MRFMMFMYPEISAADWNPTAEEMAEMSRYNLELRKAGMLLALDGLRPPTEGTSITFDGEGVKAVTDGPFTETKEAVGGYWLVQARSADEVLEWAKRCPGRNCRIEVRRIFELDEFPPDVQEAIPYDADLHPGV